MRFTVAGQTENISDIREIEGSASVYVPLAISVSSCPASSVNSLAIMFPRTANLADHVNIHDVFYFSRAGKQKNTVGNSGGVFSGRLFLLLKTFDLHIIKADFPDSGFADKKIIFVKVSAFGKFNNEPLNS